MSYEATVTYFDAYVADACNSSIGEEPAEIHDKSTSLFGVYLTCFESLGTDLDKTPSP